MTLRAFLKNDGSPCEIRPVFHDWRVGMEFKTIKGKYSGSIFTNRRENYYFPPLTRALMIPIKFYYWLSMYAKKKIVFKVRSIKFSIKQKKDLPF